MTAKYKFTTKILYVWAIFLFIKFAHGANPDDDKHIIRFANDEIPANGPFGLKDATPGDNVTIEQKRITDEWFILRKRLTWGEAITACENASAHLVNLPREEQAKQLVEAINNTITEHFSPITTYFKHHNDVEFGPNRRYWIGLADLMLETDFTWARSGLELLYDFWYPGQPDHRNNAEHCVTLWNPGYYANTKNTHMFNDEPCTKKYYAICGIGTPTY